jgi:Spy/CpxP family protein refolding chaperone
MKKLMSRIALSVGLVSALTAGAMAQGPAGQGGGRGQAGGRMMGGMGGGMGGNLTGLLMMKEVREELKLDEDQVAELEELGKAMMESMRSMRPQGGGGAGGGGGGGQPPNPQDRQAMMDKMQKANEENEAKVEEILDPKQFDRLVGLFIQSANLQSLNSKLVATRLGITEEQKTKMAEIVKANGEKMRELFQGGFGPDAREKMTKMRDESEAKIKEILTAKQKEDMEALKGAEFKFPEPQWRGGGQGGPGAGGPGAGGPGGAGGGRGNRRPGGDGN